MSNRPSSARGRRSEKEGANSEAVISRHDVKSCEFNSSRPRIQQNDKSPVPSRGGRWHTGDRADSSTSTRFSLGKAKERDDASFSRRRSTDKPGGFGGKGGRRIDSSGHGGQSRNGSDPPSSNVTHGGGKLFISREFVTTGDMKSSSDGSGGKPFMDDSRLSKLVRRACREDDRERRLLAIHQLRDYLLQPENAKGIVKVADSLLVALQDMFYERTYKEVKQEAAQCIGILGSTMGSDAQRYLQWLFAKLTAAPTDEAKILFLRALLQV
ncbi:hypothetical protein LSAT2_029981 [Lamellibrachia satsuma]|nr:hypothetical protein LSAT2_029981 [Lamellibrachia satsuma]